MMRWLQGRIVLGTALGKGKLVHATRGARMSHAKVENIILTGNMDVDAGLLQLADRHQAGVLTLGDAATLKTSIIEYEEES